MKQSALFLGLVPLLMVAGHANARFVSVDPVQANANTGQNFNRYYYVNNNPYRFTDPDGRCPADSTRRTCIEARPPPTTNTNTTVSPDAAAAARAGRSVVTVPSGSTTEKLGSINRQSDGSLKVEPIGDTTTRTTSTAYTATGTLPSNAEVVIHGHPDSSGLMDQRGTLGDAGTLATANKPNIAVGTDGRMAAHELENGTYQVRALNGTFTREEQRHFQREADKRQEFFNASGR
ncbi:hypothetical protein [Xanthomonas citri]|uniref:hypothetical protein n=1 Tax=Xanthomonas citri TaxID=346 RepID=UPI0009BC3439|nr:hypothetical protein [Xanthomonas citri]QTJ31047.1 hypothetical protein XcfCFBP6167P_24560 [Xanthomonas citri pv. phaseoli var. fuscans]